jgi:hypothetical protein
MMQGLLPLYPSCTMVAAAPGGAPPAADRRLKFKNSLPAVPRRGPEAGVLCIEDNFHGTDVNRIASCLFQQSTRNYCYNGHPPFHARRTEKTAIRTCHRNVL